MLRAGGQHARPPTHTHHINPTLKFLYIKLGSAAAAERLFHKF